MFRLWSQIVHSFHRIRTMSSQNGRTDTISDTSMLMAAQRFTAGPIKTISGGRERSLLQYAGRSCETGSTPPTIAARPDASPSASNTGDKDDKSRTTEAQPSMYLMFLLTSH